MAPYDFDEASPADAATVADYPANERNHRLAVHGAYEVEHYEADGRHRLGYGNTAARDAAMASPTDGNIWVNSDGSIQVYESGAWLSHYPSFVGQVTNCAYDPSSPPAGWLACNGAAVSRTTYSALYAVIGDAFGNGDGSTTFNVPDLGGKFVAGYKAADEDYDAIAETGGETTHQLTAAELATHEHAVQTTGAHEHAVNAYENADGTGTDYGQVQHAYGSGIVPGREVRDGAAGDGIDAYHRAASAGDHAHTVDDSGESRDEAHENRPPYVVLGSVIKT